MIIFSGLMYVCQWDPASGHLTLTTISVIKNQIDHRHPAVRDDLHAWGSWILDVCSHNWKSSLVYSDATY